VPFTLAGAAIMHGQFLIEINVQHFYDAYDFKRFEA